MRLQQLLSILVYEGGAHAALLFSRAEPSYSNSTRISQLAATQRSSSASNTAIPSPNDISTFGCWAEWADYWKESQFSWTMLTTYSSTIRIVDPTFIVGSTTIADTTTVIESNGNFPTKTFVTTIEIAEPSWSVVHTSQQRVENITDWASITITTPPCALPTFVPQCQSSWESWVDNNGWSLNRPPCTQASISGSICSKALSNWMSSQVETLGQENDKPGMATNYSTVTASGTTYTSTHSYWPTSSNVVPGCTVGCQSCKISGSNVKLLYWPPATSSLRDANFSANTAHGADAATLVAYGTTLTSPTAYISFDLLHASNSCNNIGSTMHNIVLPITNSATLSSLYGYGHYWDTQWTASFNFTDLYVDPVPESIYERQPRCASSSTSLVYSCLSLGTTGPPECQSALNNSFRCPRTLPYEPVIAIPMEVRNLQPEWADCMGGIRGVYDPPTALYAVAAVASPTMPVSLHSTLAQSTQQSDVAPTTAALPLPIHSPVASATQDPSVPQQIQTAPWASVPLDPATHASSPGALPTVTELSQSANTATSVVEDPPAQAPSVTSPLNTAASGEQSPLSSIVFAAGDQSFTAEEQSNSAVIFDPSTTIVIQPGETAFISSETLVLSQASWTGLPILSAALLSSSELIIAGPSETETLPVDAQDPASIAGPVIVVPSYTRKLPMIVQAPTGIAAAIVLDGSSILLPSVSTASLVAIWSDSSEIVSISVESNGDIVLAAEETTATYSASATLVTFAGQAVSLSDPANATGSDLEASANTPSRTATSVSDSSGSDTLALGDPAASQTYPPTPIPPYQTGGPGSTTASDIATSGSERARTWNVVLAMMVVLLQVSIATFTGQAFSIERPASQTESGIEAPITMASWTVTGLRDSSTSETLALGDPASEGGGRGPMPYGDSASQVVDPGASLTAHFDGYSTTTASSERGSRGSSTPAGVSSSAFPWSDRARNRHVVLATVLVLLLAAVALLL